MTPGTGQAERSIVVTVRLRVEVNHGLTPSCLLLASSCLGGCISGCCKSISGDVMSCITSSVQHSSCGLDSSCQLGSDTSCAHVHNSCSLLLPRLFLLMLLL